jgi:hypothetical protein
MPQMDFSTNWQHSLPDLELSNSKTTEILYGNLVCPDTMKEKMPRN